MKVKIKLNKSIDSIPCIYRFFCFTGKFKTGKRKEYQNIVNEKGGIVKDHINRLINYLVIGNEIYDSLNEPIELETINSKIADAYKLITEGFDINIISEDQFLPLVNHFKSKTYSDYLILQSFSNNDKQYKVNIKELTCECEHFSLERKEYPQDDPRRLCKHIVKALFEVNYIPKSLIEFKEKIAIAYLYKGGVTGWGKS